MAQPNANREPTMEEILASIRRIIENNDPGDERDSPGMDDEMAALEEEMTAAAAVELDEHDGEEPSGACRRRRGRKPVELGCLFRWPRWRPASGPPVPLRRWSGRARRRRHWRPPPCTGMQLFVSTMSGTCARTRTRTTDRQKRRRRAR